MTKIHLRNKFKLKAQTEGNEIVWVDDLWIDRPDIAKQLRFEQMFSRCKLFDRQVPLYQKQKPLTDADFEKEKFVDYNFMSGASFAEAKLREKNS